MGAQIGSKSPPWGQRVTRNPHLACNRTFHLYFLNAKFQLLGVCRSQFTKKKQLLFWFMTLDPFWWVWGNNSNKQLQTELKS